MSEVLSSIFSELKWTFNILVKLSFKVNIMVSVPFPHFQFKRETKQGHQSVNKVIQATVNGNTRGFRDILRDFSVFQTICQGLCQKLEEVGSSNQAQKQQVALVKYIHGMQGTEETDRV